MKRRQKKFDSELSILADIHEYQRKADALLRSSLALDESVKERLHKCGDLRDEAEKTLSPTLKKELLEKSNQLEHDAHKDKDLSQKQNKTRNNILNCTLPRLKNTLAAFRTETFAFCGNDKGVVLQ